MTKQKQLKLTVSKEVYDTVQDHGLRMIMISPEGEQAAAIHSQETGYISYETVEISMEDQRFRKLDFEHKGSDNVLPNYNYKVNGETITVRSRQLRVVLGDPIEAEADAITEDSDAH